MPTYAYQCDDCGREIEVFQKMSDEPLTECVTCGGDLKKRMFPVGIVFKGSGFYVNDYAKKSNGASSTTAAAPSPETKPEPVAEPPKPKVEPVAAPAAS